MSGLNIIGGVEKKINNSIKFLVMKNSKQSGIKIEILIINRRIMV
jgi:hypothetical protein